MSSEEHIIEDKDWSCQDEVYTNWYTCPNCKKDMVMGGASYCQDCGVKLEWNLSGTTFLPERG
jgi:predicted amidophosphoribosyltransferase